MARAMTAPRGPQWCCDKCHAIHGQWAPICDNCGGFDTLSWREATETTGPSPTGTELMPLIVGQSPAPPSEAADEEAEIIDADPAGTDAETAPKRSH
jgi:HemY protein